MYFFARKFFIKNWTQEILTVGWMMPSLKAARVVNVVLNFWICTLSSLSFPLSIRLLHSDFPNSSSFSPPPNLIFYLSSALFLSFLSLPSYNLKWIFSSFSYNITPESQDLKEHDHQLRKLLIVKQILLLSTIGNVKRSVWRICILMLG